MRTLTHLLIALMASVGVLSASVPAVAATVLFSDDFESQPADRVNNTAYPETYPIDAFPMAPTVGTWSKVSGHTSGDECVQVTRYATPGAASGDNYVRSIQRPGTYDGWQGNFVRQTTAGDLVRVEADLLFPSNVGVPFAMEVIDSSYAYPRADMYVGNWMSNNYHVWNNVAEEFFETSIPWTPGTWQHWTADFTLGAPNNTLTVDSNSQSLPVAYGAINAIDAIRFEQTGSGTGGFRVDNFKVTLNPSVAAFWTGIGDTTWSTATGLNNWKDGGDSAVDYANGDDVIFNDTATGLTADISAADVTPNSVLFNNSTKDLTVQGTYGIVGSTGLTKQGTGKVTMTSANSYTGLTTVEAGTLQLGLNAQSTVLTGGGADIQGGEIVLDYTGGSTPAATVRTALAASYATGFASGQIYSSTATTAIGLGWADDTGASALTIAYSLYGDTNLDGSVNFTDLSKLLAGYNQAGDWAEGDFDYSGAVAFADLSKMLANYNASLPGSINVGSYNLDGAAIQALSDAGITVVPEPSSLIMLASLSALVGLGVVGRRRLAGRGFLRRSFLVPFSKEAAMKRFLVLGMCIVLVGAAVANAEVVVTSSRSVYDGSLDKIDFHLTGLTGAEAGLAINGLEGTWTALGDGATLYMSSSSLGWKGATAMSASFEAPAPPLSYVNLNSIVSTAFSRTGGGNAYSDFTGTWFTTEPAAYLTPVDPDLGDGLDQTLVGTMYVSTGAGASYVGQFSMSNGVPVAGGFAMNPVPEPSTLALLACGLIGLLAYAWRKRK